MTNLNLQLREQHHSVQQKYHKKRVSSVYEVLVDADALIALTKKNDSNHQRAIDINTYLQAIGTTFYVSPFTIPEVVTVLSHRVGQPQAISFLKKIRQFQISELRLPDIEAADECFAKQQNKGTSYPDCYNIALLENFSFLDAIFSFDTVYTVNNCPLAEKLEA